MAVNQDSESRDEIGESRDKKKGELEVETGVEGSVFSLLDGGVAGGSACKAGP